MKTTMLALAMLAAFSDTAHGAGLLDPYERSPYVQTLPQMQREWEREKYDRKMIDYRRLNRRRRRPS